MKQSIFNLDYQNTNLASKIAIGLERISNAYRVLLWDYAKELGLSPIQIQILIFVKYHQENLCSVSLLAKEFNVTKPTISDAVRVLHKKEYIIKNTSGVDKRAYAIGLSNTGEKIVEQTELFANPIEEIIADFPLAEQAQFFKLLSNLIHRLNNSGIISVQRTCPSCRYFQKDKNGQFCKLLNAPLLEKEIRLDCPEFEGI